MNDGKECIACRERKPLSEYNSNQSRCRLCQREVNRKWRQEHPERFKALQKAWREQHPDYSATHARENRAQRNANARRARLANPEKIAARNAVNNARIRGSVARPSSCGQCGKACKPEAHHHDYSKPMDVAWLCRRCHLMEHQKEHA